MTEYVRVDLERLDERDEDLSAWACEDEDALARARDDEVRARGALRPLASGVHVTSRHEAGRRP